MIFKFKFKFKNTIKLPLKQRKVRKSSVFGRLIGGLVTLLGTTEVCIGFCAVLVGITAFWANLR